MEILRTAVLRGGASGLVEMKLDNWRKGLQGESLMIELDMPVNVGIAGTPTTADLDALLGYFLATVNLSFGPNGEFKPFEGASGSDLRLVSRFMTGREISNNFVGVAQTIGDKRFKARIHLPCAPRQMRSALRKLRRIGYAQGRTIKVEVAEGAACPAGSLTFTRTAGADCNVSVAVDYRVGPSTWCRIPSFRAINRDALDVTGPDGLTLFAADANAAHASTAIGKHTVDVGGNEVSRQIAPLYAGEAYSRSLDAGSTDITDKVTLFYSVDPQGEVENAPTGPVRITLVSQDVATLKLRVCYLPDVSDSEVQTAAQLGAQAEGGPVVATIPELPEDAHRGTAAAAPVEIIPAKDSRYKASPGIVATPDGALGLSIPKVVGAQVSAFVAGHDPASRKDAATYAQKKVALRIPGAIGTNGHGRGAALGRQGIRSHFAPLFR